MFLQQIARSFRVVTIRHLLPDIVIVGFCIYFSLFLRVGFNEKLALHYFTLLYYLPVIFAIRFSVFILFDVYSILWRYFSVADVIKITRAVLVSTGLIIAASFFLGDYLGRLPRSVYLIDSFLLLVGMLSSRLVRRVIYESRDQKGYREGRRTLIYGAGKAGKMLANRFLADRTQDSFLLGFVDDDVRKVGLSIGGVRVLGSFEDLDNLLQRNSITQLIIASNSLPSSRVLEIMKIARRFNIMPRRVDSGLNQKSLKDVAIERKINLSDLLNRSVREVDLTALRSLIKGKRVLVTGAGGSIGQEISRQIHSADPSRLAILDHSELNLYEIDKELRLSSTEMDRVVPILLDLKNGEAVQTRLRDFMPEVIFHAAAYKHVHLVEANPYSAILNNVLSTLNVLEAAKSIGTSHFVLISSDKAVNPAGVMGATKRVCELLVTAFGKSANKHFVSVRFGNVLGSSGSLIPLLEKQIEEGGPVTVTHQDMTRYFMTIPEAVSLVLKAATIAKPGEINVLKMGDPVKILDVAKAMIALKGLKEDQIDIVFTGLRPGEKLYEELYLKGDELLTEHPDILTLPDGDADPDLFGQAPERLIEQVKRLLKLAQESSVESIHALNGLVKSAYVPPENVYEESRKVTFLIQPQKRDN
jgi:FlaA1/EpsC-like NDP-sugar epimerase